MPARWYGAGPVVETVRDGTASVKAGRHSRGMKPLHIVLLLVAGAAGGALVMRVAQRQPEPSAPATAKQTQPPEPPAGAQAMAPAPAAATPQTLPPVAPAEPV